MVENEIPDQKTPEVEKKVEPIVVSQLLAEVSWGKDGKEKRGVLVVLANTNNDLELLELKNPSQSIEDFLSDEVNQGIILFRSDHPAQRQYHAMLTTSQDLLPQLEFLTGNKIHSRIIELDKIKVDDQVEGPDILQVPIIKIDGKDDANEFSFADHSLYEGFAKAAIASTGKQTIVLIPVEGDRASYILAVALKTDETTTIGHSGPAGERLIGEVVSVLFSDLSPKHGGERRPYLQRLIEHYKIKPEELVNQVIAKLREETDKYISAQYNKNTLTGKWRIAYAQRIGNGLLNNIKRELVTRLKQKKGENATDLLLDFFSVKHVFISNAFNKRKPLEAKLQQNVVNVFFENKLSLPTVLIETVENRVRISIKPASKGYLAPAEALRAIRNLGQILTQEVGATDDQPIDLTHSSEIVENDHPTSEPPASIRQEKPPIKARGRLELTNDSEVGSKIRYERLTTIFNLRRNLSWPIFRSNPVSYSGPDVAVTRSDGTRNGYEPNYLFRFWQNDSLKFYVNGRLKLPIEAGFPEFSFALKPGDVLTIEHPHSETSSTFVQGCRSLELITTTQCGDAQMLETDELSQYDLPIGYRVIGYALTDRALNEIGLLANNLRPQSFNWRTMDGSKSLATVVPVNGSIKIERPGLPLNHDFVLVERTQQIDTRFATFKNQDEFRDIILINPESHFVARHKETGNFEHLVVTKSGLVVTYSEKAIPENQLLEVDDNNPPLEQLSADYPETTFEDHEPLLAESLGYPVDYTEITETSDDKKVYKLKLKFNLMIDGLSRRYGATEIVITILELRNNTAIKFESAYFSLNSNFPKINGRVLSPNEVKGGVNLYPGDVITIQNYYGQNYSTFLFDSTRKLRLLFSNQFQDTGSYSTIAPIGMIDVATQSQTKEKIPADSYEIIGYAGMINKTITWDDIGVLQITANDDGRTIITYKSNELASQVNGSQLQPGSYLYKQIGPVVHWVTYLPNGLIVTYRKDSGGKLIPVKKYDSQPSLDQQIADEVNPRQPEAPARPHVERQPRLQPGGEMKKIVTIEKPDEATIGFPLQLETRLDDGGLPTSTRSVRLMDGQRLLYNHNPDLDYRGPTVDVSITSNREYRTQSIYLTCDSIEASNQLLVVINGLASDNQPVYKYHLGTATTNFQIQPGDIITIQNKNGRFSSTYLFTFDLQLELISATDISTETLFEVNELNNIPVPYQVVGYLDLLATNRQLNQSYVIWWPKSIYLIPYNDSSSWYLKFDESLGSRNIYKLVTNEQPFLIKSSTPILPGDHLVFNGIPTKPSKQKEYHLKFLNSGLVVTYETLN